MADWEFKITLPEHRTLHGLTQLLSALKRQWRIDRMRPAIALHLGIIGGVDPLTVSLLLTLVPFHLDTACCEPNDHRIDHMMTVVRSVLLLAFVLFLVAQPLGPGVVWIKEQPPFSPESVCPYPLGCKDLPFAAPFGEPFTIKQRIG